jgi:glucosamine--fructose-6-phosphate aminotransferase (isomerizing)
MARLSDYTIELYAGNEVAVASTKTYVAEAVILLALAYKIANKEGLKKELILLKDEIKHILVRKEEIKSFALELSSAKEMFIIGKGLDFYLTKEASLKFREVPYLNAISYPSGELKHGPLALIDEDTPVLAIVTNEKTSHITRINLEEAITRHALGFVISSDNVKKDNDRFIIKYIGDILTPLALTTVIQLLSYEIGYARGNDIDKPKNIAKCVTVD